MAAIVLAAKRAASQQRNFFASFLVTKRKILKAAYCYNIKERRRRVAALASHPQKSKQSRLRHAHRWFLRFHPVRSIIGGPLARHPAATPLAADAGGQPRVLPLAGLAGLPAALPYDSAGLAGRAAPARQPPLVLCRPGRGIGPADAAQTAPRRLAAGAGVLAAHLGRERAASAGHRVFQPAIDQLPGGRPPGQAGAGIAVRPAALLCVVFSVHHPGAVQPL